MNNEQLVNRYNALCVMQKIEGSSYQFKSFVNKHKRAIKKQAEDVIEELELMNETLREKGLKYCMKDSNGNAIYEDIYDRNGVKTNNKRLVGLLPGQCKDFDNEIKSIQESKKELLKKESEFDNKIQIYLNKSHIPEDLNGELLEFIEDFING